MANPLADQMKERFFNAGGGANVVNGGRPAHRVAAPAQQQQAALPKNVAHERFMQTANSLMEKRQRFQTGENALTRQQAVDLAKLGHQQALQQATHQGQIKSGENTQLHGQSLETLGKTAEFDKAKDHRSLVSGMLNQGAKPTAAMGNVFNSAGGFNPDLGQLSQVPTATPASKGFEMVKGEETPQGQSYIRLNKDTGQYEQVMAQPGQQQGGQLEGQTFDEQNAQAERSRKIFETRNQIAALKTAQQKQAYFQQLAQQDPDLLRELMAQYQQ
jgi:hypothetical protein